MNRHVCMAWTEIERHYARPTVMGYEFMAKARLPEVALGVTTIVYACGICGMTRKLEVLGEAMRQDADA